MSEDDHAVLDAAIAKVQLQSAQHQNASLSQRPFPGHELNRAMRPLKANLKHSSHALPAESNVDQVSKVADLNTHTVTECPRHNRPGTLGVGQEGNSVVLNRHVETVGVIDQISHRAKQWRIYEKIMQILQEDDAKTGKLNVQF